MPLTPAFLNDDPSVRWIEVEMERRVGMDMTDLTLGYDGGLWKS